MTGELPGGWIEITRRAEFSASHRLHHPQLSAEENEELFKNCNWPGGHGHNYLLEVTVKGEVDPKSGMVMNLKDLKSAIRVRIVDPCDHRNLNEDVPFLKGLVTTTENLCRAFWRELEDEFEKMGYPGRLYCIRIQETRDNSVSYKGPLP
jgi:6-pyruvoyltetrahydropterin/6-carboxytetrahydropterin synthase